MYSEYKNTKGMESRPLLILGQKIVATTGHHPRQISQHAQYLKVIWQILVSLSVTECHCNGWRKSCPILLVYIVLYLDNVQVSKMKKELTLDFQKNEIPPLSNWAAWVLLLSIEPNGWWKQSLGYRVLRLRHEGDKGRTVACKQTSRRRNPKQTLDSSATASVDAQ